RGARVMGIDGGSKMSKSLDNHIGVVEDPEAIWEKLRPAKTDEARKRRSDPGSPDRCNIFSYHKLVTPEGQIEEIVKGCTEAGIGCIDCKKIFFANLRKVLDPIRERRMELEAKPEFVREALREGARKARTIAQETVQGAKALMGLVTDF
ncbi:MAG: tryptophan--tRNA ligase, partial [Candidatus Aminicenantes bacterium]